MPLGTDAALPAGLPTTAPSVARPSPVAPATPSATTRPALRAVVQLISESNYAGFSPLWRCIANDAALFLAHAVVEISSSSWDLNAARPHSGSGPSFWQRHRTG